MTGSRQLKPLGIEAPLPPEMLPVCPNTEVVVCMGECDNEPPCPLCVTIRPGDDLDDLFRRVA